MILDKTLVKILLMLKAVIRGLFLVFTVLTVTFLIGELSIRYIQNRTKPPSKVRQRDALTHHSFQPNTHDVARSPESESRYDINSVGLRDREYSLDKPQNSFRVLMVGDSYIEGQGVRVEETVSKILERSLGEKVKDKKIEVINAGILSYSPLLEYLYLKHRGLKLNPDLVILNFDESDIIDDLIYESELIKDSQGLPAGFPKPVILPENFYEGKQFLPFVPTLVKKFLHQNSALYLVIANSVKTKKLLIYPEIGKIEIIPGNPLKDKLITTRDKVENYEALWAITKRNLKWIVELLNENKVRLLLNIYPYAHQVSATEWSEGRKAWSLEPKIYTHDRDFQTLESFASLEKVPFHSMVPDFRSEQNHPLFFKVDGHWTKLGHQVAARSLEKYLLDSGMIK